MGVRDAVSADTLRWLDDTCANAPGERIDNDNDEILEEVTAILTDEKIEFELSKMVDDFYVVDLALRLSGPVGETLGVIFTPQDNPESIRHDPWSILKWRHLPSLEMRIVKISAADWRDTSSEERLELVRSLLSI